MILKTRDLLLNNGNSLALHCTKRESYGNKIVDKNDSHTAQDLHELVTG